jgi:hypothetical protein
MKPGDLRSPPLPPFAQLRFYEIVSGERHHWLGLNGSGELGWLTVFASEVRASEGGQQGKQ